MASIRKKRNSYEIRVSCGYDLNGKQKFQQMTWKPEEGMTPKQIEKEVNRQAVLFEEKCLKGQVTANVKFEEFAEQWFKEYAKLNLRNTSYEKMKQLPPRVYPAIGICGLTELQADTFSNSSMTLRSTEEIRETANRFRGKPLYII